MSHPFAALDDEERHFLVGVGQVVFSNPFDDTRPAGEKAALGDDFDPSCRAWCRHGDLVLPRVNALRIAARLRPLLARVSERIARGATLSDADRLLYIEACLYFLFDTHEARFQPFIQRRADRAAIAALYKEFLAQYKRLFVLIPGLDLRPPPPEHVFACCYQLRRAFFHIFSKVVGTSAPVDQLRAEIWRAIVTRDTRRYIRSCDRRRMDVSTLIVGESGTGKELAAQAIGLSGYTPWDPKEERFTLDPDEGFHAVNLSALSDSLFEAELFGHERGAFTGAVRDRLGVFSACGRDGAVLLDEIGELAPSRQVTLLRVLEARRFYRVGDTEEQVLSARILAATNRDLVEAIRNGTFRLDLYERLAAIQILTPTLAQQLEAAPGQRRELVRFFAGKWVDPEDVEELTDEVEDFIETTLPGYTWPGNVRELRRCVEGVYAVGRFVPLDPTAVRAPPVMEPVVEKVGPVVAESEEDEEEDPLRSVRALELSEEEVRQRYASMVFESVGEKQDEAARVLGINRKTVAARLDHKWLARRARRRGGGGGAGADAKVRRTSAAGLDELIRFVRAEPEDELMAQRQKETVRVLLDMAPEVRAAWLAEAEVARGRAALRRVLACRGLLLAGGEEARIDACTDPATLERWLEQAVDAGSAAESLR